MSTEDDDDKIVIATPEEIMAAAHVSYEVPSAEIFQLRNDKAIWDRFYTVMDEVIDWHYAEIDQQKEANHGMPVVKPVFKDNVIKFPGK